MIEARALVVRAGEGKIWVRLSERQGGCGRCDEPGGCRAPRLVEMFQGGEKLFVLDNPLGLGVGERVRIVIDDGAPLRAALASYGLGTALILAGAALGVWLAPLSRADLAAAAGMALGAVIAAFILRLRARRGLAAWHPRAERDCESAAAECARQSA